MKQTLERVCASIPPPRASGKTRLFVDRVFTVHGSGTVVTGTLAGGLNGTTRLTHDNFKTGGGTVHNDEQIAGADRVFAFEVK